MRKKFVLFLAVLGLSGCMQGPTSTDEVRSMTATGSMFSKRSTVTVPQSYAAVTANLKKGAAKCLNRTVRSTSSTPGPYGPQVMTIVTDYSSTVKASGGRTELSLYQQVRGSLFPQPKGISYVVDATPTSGGTQLVFHGGRWGYAQMNKAVEQWARGGSLTCPKLPGS